jgi:hypothetical protein
MKKFVIALVGGLLLSCSSALILRTIETLWDSPLSGVYKHALNISILSSIVIICVCIITVFFIAVKEFTQKNEIGGGRSTKTNWSD